MWIKQGNIFNKHAQLPTVLILDEVLRVFYSTRQDNRSRICAIDVDANDPRKVIKEYGTILDLGERGCFDDCGVMPSCVAKIDGRYALYYTGWNTDKGGVPYGHGIGVAFSNDGINFNRHSKGPVLDRTPDTPYLVNSPFVTKRDNLQFYTMWFCNGGGWDENFPLYNICLATSDDGIHWNFCLSTDIKGSRPCVVYDGDACDNNVAIWNSVKTKDSHYSIQVSHAKSIGSQWTTTPGLAVSESGWDSEMVCYPYVIVHKGRKMMFYNGNGYGATGIGYAELA